MTTLRPCTDCEDDTSRVGPLGEPLCGTCREIRIDKAVADPGGSNIKVVAMQKDCDACGYRRSVPVTTVLGCPPDWDRLCEACISLADAVCFERQAARLRERAALILRARKRRPAHTPTPAEAEDRPPLPSEVAMARAKGRLKGRAVQR